MVSVVLSCEQEIKQMQVDNASSKRIDVRSFHILLIIYSVLSAKIDISWRMWKKRDVNKVKKVSRHIPYIGKTT